MGHDTPLSRSGQTWIVCCPSLGRWETMADTHVRNWYQHAQVGLKPIGVLWEVQGFGHHVLKRTTCAQRFRALRFRRPLENVSSRKYNEKPSLRAGHRVEAASEAWILPGKSTSRCWRSILCLRLLDGITQHGRICSCWPMME